MASFQQNDQKHPMKALTVFIVEDEPLIVATIETALKKQGFKVLGDCDEMKESLLLIDKLQPDLVLVDIHLEGLKDGVDLALELDKRKQPYLFLTSQTDPQTIARVKQTKPLGFIVKPFTENGLRSNIELAWHNFSLTEEDYLLIKDIIDTVIDFNGRIYLAKDSNLSKDQFAEIFNKAEFKEVVIKYNKLMKFRSDAAQRYNLN